MLINFNAQGALLAPLYYYHYFKIVIMLWGVLGPLTLLSLFQNRDSHMGGPWPLTLLSLFQNSDSHMGDHGTKNVPKNEKVPKIRLLCDHDLSLIVELSRASYYSGNYNSPIVGPRSGAPNHSSI